MIPPQIGTILVHHHRRNQLHTLLVLFALGAWMAVVGWLVAGVQGVMWAVLVTTLVVVVVPPLHSVAVLRAMFGAVPLSPAQAPGLIHLIAELAERAGLPQPPPLLLIPRPDLIALSTGGGNDVSIAVSSGFLAIMPPNELVAVLAHEVSHLRHGDTFILRLADAAARLTRILSLFGLLTIVLYLPAFVMSGSALPLSSMLLMLSAPVFSTLLTMKLSRTREYEADAGAIELTRNPRALMSALDRIERLQGGGAPNGFWGWFLRLPLIRSHPETYERIQRLEEMVPAMDEEASQLDLGLIPSLVEPGLTRTRKPRVWFG